MIEIIAWCVLAFWIILTGLSFVLSEARWNRTCGYKQESGAWFIASAFWIMGGFILFNAIGSVVH